MARAIGIAFIVPPPITSVNLNTVPFVAKADGHRGVNFCPKWAEKERHVALRDPLRDFVKTTKFLRARSNSPRYGVAAVSV